MTLNGRNVTLAKIKKFTEPTRKKFNEDRSILLTAKCRSIILVSRNMKCMWVFTGGSIGEGASSRPTICANLEHGFAQNQIGAKYGRRREQNYGGIAYIYRAHRAVIFAIARHVVFRARLKYFWGKMAYPLEKLPRTPMSIYPDNSLYIFEDNLSHIVNDCPVNKFEGGLPALHRAYLFRFRRVHCIR